MFVKRLLNAFLHGSLNKAAWMLVSFSKHGCQKCPSPFRPNWNPQNAGASMEELKYVEILTVDVQVSTVDVVYQAVEPQIFQHGPQSQ